MIEDKAVIKKILKHLGLWEIKTRPLPKPIGKTRDYHPDEDYVL